MATITTPPVVQPVNRPFALLPPPGEQLYHPWWALPDYKRLRQAWVRGDSSVPAQMPRFQKVRPSPEEPGRWAALPSLVVTMLAVFAVLLFWPVVFVALVLFLLGLVPFVALGAVLRAIVGHGHRVAG